MEERSLSSMSQEVEHVKQEQLWEEDSAGPRAAGAGNELAAAVTDDKLEKAVCIKEETGDLEEPAWENQAASGISEAAARAGLYAGHRVKDELVVGPESLQPPDNVFTKELRLSASWIKDCCVKLEQCDRLLERRTLGTEPASPQNNIYECDTCAKTYPYKSTLARHVLTHFKSKVPKSKRKQRTKDTDSSIQQKGRTLIQHKKEKTFSCEMCSKKFARKAHLESHNLIHAGVKPLICQICNKGFRQLSNLKRHERTHMGERPYSCDVCNKNFSESGNLKQHQRIHMNLKPNEPVSRQKNIYECATCAKTCTYKSNLVRHIQTHFKSKAPKSKRKQRTKATVSSIQREGRTLIQRKKEKTFSCEKCSKKFARNDHLERHNLIHEGVKPHICQICNKRFRLLDNLKIHGRTHTGEKPYSCDVCNKKFSHSGNLTAHQRIHMNLKPFVCEICNHRFRVSSTLAQHKRTHTREKPFHCTICRKSFKWPRYLKIHQRIHSGEKPYSCEICLKRFSRSDTLLYHVLAHAGKGPLANRKAKRNRPSASLTRAARVPYKLSLVPF